MSEEEFKELTEDIGQRGLMQSVLLYQGKILDGNHRYRACETVKKPAHFTEFEGTDAEAKAIVISANIHRRHLTPEKRREIIEVLIKADPAKSNRQIGKTAKVDHKTVGAVREGMEERGEIPHVETRTDSTGRNQPAKKGGKGKSGTRKSGNDKEKITYQKVVNAKTALNAYSVLEEHLLDALQDVNEHSDFSQADDCARRTIEKLEECLGEMQPEEEEADAA
jgi:ParB-like chromosome segregation protein Spo0J